MVLGGPRYESIRDESQDNSNNNSNNNPARSSAWSSLTRRPSDQSATDDFELSPVNDRTGLTSYHQHRPPLLDQESQEDLLQASTMASSSQHLQPPEMHTRRPRRSNLSGSNISGDSSLRPKSTTPSSHLASMKQVLGRASTRVIGLAGSSRRQPHGADSASLHSKRELDEDNEGHEQDALNRLDGDQEARASMESNRTATPRAGEPSRIAMAPSAGPPQGSPELVWIEPPLEGRSLFIFGPDNSFRKMINRLLNQTWVELALLVLLVVNLAFLIIAVSSPINRTDTVWGGHWTDYGLFAVFVIYTLEIGARIIVSGLVLYPQDGDKIRKFFGKKPRTDNLHDTNPTILRKSPEAQRARTMAPQPQTSSAKLNEQAVPHSTGTTRATTIIDYAFGRQTTMMQFIPTYMDPLVAYKPQFIAAQGTQVPFLRHTFNRIDFVAVACYWVDFFLMISGVRGVYFFKAVAAMRTLRLLNITAGSATILHSLKKSAPLLVNIVLFIAFFFIIFSIVGVQAFKGSLSRRCVNAQNNSIVLDDVYCGGHYDPVNPGSKQSYVGADGMQSLTAAKGNICAQGFICKDTGTNFENAISFDNIFSAMVPVYVLMTGQTWTDLMYHIMDAEYAWSAVYFVLVVLVMNFWILNLFVAVINEMFAKIRDDSANNSAFSSEKSESKNQILNDSIKNFTYTESEQMSRRKKWVETLECVWVAAIIVDLVFQCLPRYDTPPEKLLQFDRIELGFTIAFAVDIAIRFLVCLPMPMEFFKSRKNLVDLFLATVTMLIQIPPIKNSHVYLYLTVFQVVRIYRPIIYIERLRSLIQRVVGSWIGLLNLVMFIAVFVAVVSVMAGILFRENVDPEEDHMTFADFYVSYLGMYQIFSGENWTTILYSVMQSSVTSQIVVATIFIIAFYSFANFVLLNMLIAIIMENFEGGTEASKHAQQILDFAAKEGYSKRKEREFVLYLTKYLKPMPKSIGVDSSQSGWIHRMRKGLARQFLLGDNELFHSKELDPMVRTPSDPTRRHHRRRSSQNFGPLELNQIDDTEHFRNLYGVQAPGTDEAGSIIEPVKSNKFFSMDSLRHRSLFIFGPDNKLRKMLQPMVTPGRGRRIEGVPENVLLSRPFNLIITIAILACVVVAAVTTPVWRFNQLVSEKEETPLIIRVSDWLFPVFFTVEFLIRVIADGFIFTPDAYLKTLWNQIDFFVLLTLYAPWFANLGDSQGVARFFRSLKALRALRLINQSAYIKGTFHAVLVAGFPQLFDATLLSMSLIVPFAIYGMRMFSGQFYSCNDKDPSIERMEQCVGIFFDKGIEGLSEETGFYKPRVWSNPRVYSFDNFGDSFLIMFEIVSQEGWSGVMETARDVVGLGMQMKTDASRYNAMFFVLYNLAGGYFVSALFVAIVIENYTKRTGTAFMTANQRRWMDLKKLLGGIHMSKYMSTPPASAIRRTLYNIVSPKRGWFVRLLTVVTIINGIVVATEHVDSPSWEVTKAWISLGLLTFYIVEIVLKIGGLGWSGYRKNRWNIYNGSISIAAFVLTVCRIFWVSSVPQPLIQTQKLLLTAILFRLVPRSNSLNQLFMTMAASINSIASLFGVWLVVFAVYGIMFVEIFGLTSYGPNGSDHVNFRNIGAALLMMARMSTGEGWNDLMHDFAVERPYCVNNRFDYLYSDCGSTSWAYALFITFNIISMYIFTNMFIVVVMHNFSYVYQIAPGFSLINRDEIRAYKRVWAEVDRDRTGFIQEKDLAKFLMKLRGVFDVRIYTEEHSIAKLQSRLETAKPTAVKISARDLEKNAASQSNQTRKVLMLNQTSRRTTLNWDDELKGASAGKGAGQGQGRPDPSRPNLLYKLDVDYNLAAFNSAIANIDRERVRQKRKVFNFLYTEAIMSMEPIPGTELRKRRSRFFPWRSLGRQAGTSAAAGAGGASGAGPGPEAGDYEMGGLGEDDTPEEGLKGISFQKMLMILAHYKLIEDDQCLSIRDMFHHRQKMDRIHAHMNVIKIRSVLLKFLIRQRFLKHYRAVQRIQAMMGGASWSDDQPPIGGDPSSSPPPPPPSSAPSGPSSSSSSTPLVTRSAPMATSASPAGAGVGSSQHTASMAQAPAAYSSVSSTSSSPSSRKQVRINVDDNVHDTRSSSTVAFSDSNVGGPGSSLSLKSVIEEDPIEPVQAGAMIDDLRSEWRRTTDAGQAAALQSAPGVFQIMDMNTPRPSPRREVLGLDYL
ncbi:Ion transport protein-domain-containing protein [Linnemannia elongata]|nr:Ion transport protein-domain-containing protein [Linnemannia elongata]